MSRVRLQHSVEHFFFRRFRAAILRRPHREVRAFGARLGRWGFKVVGRSRRQALTNLERVFPQRSDAERQQIARACFEHAGSTFCEAMSLARFGADEILDLYDIEGWERLDAVRERMAGSGRGFFFHTGHFGHWEMALHPFTLRLPPFYAVARPLNNPLVSRDLMAVRERLGARMIDKKGASFEMRRACRNGGHVGIMIDQHLRGTSAIQVPFLGHDAWTSPGLAVLALKLRVPVVPVACYPAEPPGRYRLVIGEPVWPGEETSGKPAVASFTRRVLADLEEHIRRRPDLWLWMHRRWR